MVRLKTALQKKLTAKELAVLRGGFDIVGSIAIIEIPDELRNREKVIARVLMGQNNSVKTVLKKVGKHAGIFRAQKTKFLAGVKTKEALHKESGILMKLDVDKCYFSPRLVSERLRIANLIQSNEKVLVMFSGVAPYPLVFAKCSPAKLIVAIEKNPVAHKYAVENLALNKIQKGKIILFNADVNKKIPVMKEKFDRIVMPLPRTGEVFLPLAFRVLKKKGVIHLYQFADKDNFDLAVKTVFDICKKAKKKCVVQRIVKAGQYAPRKYRVCMDLQVY